MKAEEKQPEKEKKSKWSEVKGEVRCVHTAGHRRAAGLWAFTEEPDTESQGHRDRDESTEANATRQEEIQLWS